MTELMQECLHLAESEQSRLFGCRFCEVHHDRDMRTHILTLAVYPLTLVLCHPRTSLFALSRVEIGIEDSKI